MRDLGLGCFPQRYISSLTDFHPLAEIKKVRKPKATIEVVDK